MAYSVTGEDTPVIRKVGDYWYAFWQIVELDAEPTSEFTIDLSDLLSRSGMSNEFELTYLNSMLTTAGTAATIRAIMGRLTAPAVSTAAVIHQEGAAAYTYSRKVSSSRFVMPTPESAKLIYFRSTPNAGVATRIDTEIAIKVGHW